MIAITFSCVALLTVCLVSAETGTGGLDKLIDDVFGPPNGANTPAPPSRPVDQVDLNAVDAPGTPETHGSLGLNGIGGDFCTCVPYYLCVNDSIVRDGEGLIDIRSQVKLCTVSVDVCCKDEGIVPRDDKHPLPTPRPKPKSKCGTRNTDGVGFRITGNVNNEAQFGEFPWMVAILRMEDVDGDKLSVFKCGGALIHKQVVLTAAHCVSKIDPLSLKARAGEWDTQTAQELLPHQDRYATKIIIHEKYHAGSLRNDIALVVLDEPFDSAENVDIVCLPQQNDVILDESCWASGWGKDTFGKQGKYQVILKRVELPMVPSNKCQAELRKTRLGPMFNLDESFVCAGGIAGRDTCRGDGGSPLVCPIKGKKYQYQQVGIVAWGIGCGGEIPAAYVNVAKFRHWIDDHMAALNFHTDYSY